MRLLLLLSIVIVLIQSSPEDADKEKDALMKAQKILTLMDYALETKNFKEFLDIHMNNFQFKFCKATGKSVEDLKNILDTDPNMSQTLISKHSVKTQIGLNGITKQSNNTWKFLYEEHLLLKNEEVYHTEGTINFVDLGTDIKVISAEEECPEKVF